MHNGMNQNGDMEHLDHGMVEVQAIVEPNDDEDFNDEEVEEEQRAEGSSQFDLGERAGGESQGARPRPCPLAP